MRKLLSIPQYAKHSNRALSTVQTAVKTGRITTEKDARGRDVIDVAHADRQWKRNTDPTKQNRKAASATPPPPKKNTDAVRKFGARISSFSRGGRWDSDSDEDPGFFEAKTERERAVAGLKWLELEEKSGRLVDVGRVQREAIRTARTVRDGLLKIPDRLSSILAAESDTHKVYSLLTAEINGALAELTEKIREDEEDDDATGEDK